MKRLCHSFKCFLILLTAAMLAFSSAVCAEGLDNLAPEGGLPSLTPYFPQKVTEYDRNYETGEWEAVRIYTFTYENGYPVLVDCYDINLDDHQITRHQYTFQDGVPLTRETSNDNGNDQTRVEYKDGNVYNIRKESADKMSVSEMYFQYGNGGNYFTMVMHASYSQDPNLPDAFGAAEESDAVSVTESNGLLVRTVNTGMYANWNEETEKEWLRFSGTYAAVYDCDGIVACTSSVHRTGPSGIDNRFETVRENGVITKAYVLNPEGEEWTCYARFDFEYTDVAMPSFRYAAMVNSFLMGEENNWYKFFWY